MRRGGLTIGFVSLAAISSCAPSSAPAPGLVTNAVQSSPGVSLSSKLADDLVVVGQTVYIPIRSTVATADNARPINLAATLTVRNVDRGRAIVIGSIDYRDSGGPVIRRFLDQPIKVAPMASLDLFVRESDNSGGPSPSFLVDWVADGEVVTPIVEAVMVSTAGSQGITLSSAGRVIADLHR